MQGNTASWPFYPECTMTVSVLVSMMGKHPKKFSANSWTKKNMREVIKAVQEKKGQAED
jgi:hypothetical protein